MRNDLSELWREARQFGRVNIFTADNGTYSCVIRFNTIKHAELQAKSGYNHSEPELAVAAALDKAKEIVGEMTEMTKLLEVKV